MSELTIIKQQEVLGKQFKVYGDYDSPLFLAKDVAEWIEYDSSSINKMLSTVDEDEKLNGTLFLSGQNRRVDAVKKSFTKFLIKNNYIKR
jgi:prophage antirepressor-like protein